MTRPGEAAFQVLHYWASRAVGRLTDERTSAEWRPNAQLRTIFSLVKPDVEPTYVRQAELRVDDERVFPQLQADTTGYAARKAALEQALDTQGLSEQVALTHLLDALERETWCLSSPLPHISLYDFARVQAALAAAKISGGDLLLVGGDVSGVQDFIYDVQPQRAAKQLRGRSLYLQLLSEAIARYVIDQADMPEVCLLYNGGGRFYAVVPKAVEAQLKTARRHVAHVLLVRHGIAPYLALGWQSLEGDYAKLWKNLQDTVGDQKQRKFAELNADAMQALLFNPREAPQFNRPEVLEAGENDELKQDAFEDSINTLSRNLANAQLLAERSWNEKEPLPTVRTAMPWHNVLGEFGHKIWPAADNTEIHQHGCAERLRAMRDLTEPERKAARVALGEHGSLGQRYTVNEVAKVLSGDTDGFVPDQSDIDEDGIATRDSLANDLPKGMPKVGDPMPFSLMAHLSTGIKRWGVLRMDIDDLGQLFGRTRVGEPSLADLAETAALSAALSRFFEGRVGAICREVNKERKHGGALYTVYSGGDDLFIVGSWYLLPGLAARIRREFAHYVTGVNSMKSPITLSGTLSIIARSGRGEGSDA